MDLIKVPKALNDLTQALKGKSNPEGLKQIKSLKHLEEVLTITPQPIKTQLHTAEPRVGNSSQVTNNIPKPRVETSKVTYGMILLVHAQEGAPKPKEPEVKEPTPKKDPAPKREVEAKKEPAPKNQEGEGSIHQS
jgi:hypothetical protein